ncbi:MAG: hypothetical protein ACM3SR_12340 [Ignavibacteriales bacterium]
MYYKAITKEGGAVEIDVELFLSDLREELQDTSGISGDDIRGIAIASCDILKSITNDIILRSQLHNEAAMFRRALDRKIMTIAEELLKTA